MRTLHVCACALSCVLASIGSAEAAQWSRTYGGTGNDSLVAIQPTADGGFVAAGYTTSFGAGEFDGWLLRFDRNGNVLWQKSYASATGDQGFRDARQTQDGGFIVVGWARASASANSDAWVLKTDRNGNVVWQKTYAGSGSDSANGVRQLGDGSYAVVGSTDSFGTVFAKIWVLNLDSNGEIAWQKRYGAGYDGSRWIEPVGGGYLVAGSTAAGIANPPDGWVAQLDDAGNIAWQGVYGGSGGDGISMLAPTADGGHIAAGFTTTFGGGGFDALAIKLDAGGNVTWSKAYGGANYDAAQTVLPVPGGYLIAGSTRSYGAGNSDVWLLRLDSSGNVLWQRTYGGAGEDNVSVIAAADGGFIAAGTTNSFGAGSYDAWILKLDANGDIAGCTLVAPTNVTAIAGNIAASAGTSSAVATDAVATTGSATSASTDATRLQQCYFGAAPGADATGVPTLSVWGLAAASGALALWGSLLVRQARRRRAPRTPI